MKLIPAVTLGLALSLLQSCVSSMPGERVTPQRPTFSSNTNTTAAGTVEVEAGGQWEPGTSFLTPTTLKYGTDERTELFFSWVPIVYDEGTTTVGPTRFGARHRYFDGSESAPSAAVEVLVDIPTGNNRLNSGEMATRFAGILTGHVEQWSLTGYGGLDLVGDPADKGVDPGLSLAFEGNRPIQDRWYGYGELAGVFVPNQNYDPVFAFAGAAYELAEWMMFDFGILVGLSSDAPDFALTFGLTRNFGRLSQYVKH